jgi:hypothetical protein
MNKIIIIGGSKGGVGKSIVAMALIESYVKKGREYRLFETDTSNPDVAKIYKENIIGPSENDTEEIPCFNLDHKEGWIELVNELDSTDAMKDCVINTAARSNDGVARYGGSLNDSVVALGRELITLWPINRQKDSIELLKEYIKTMDKSKIYVLLNKYFGEPEKFQLYNATNTKKIVDTLGGARVFPDLADRITELVNETRTPPHKLRDLKMGDKIEYTRWLNECLELFNEIIFDEKKEEA